MDPSDITFTSASSPAQLETSGINSTTSVPLSMTSEDNSKIVGAAGNDIPPCIIGNVNTANMLASTLINRNSNASVLSPQDILGLSVLNNGTSLIGIMPVFIQQNNSSLSTSIHNSYENEKNSIPLTTDTELNRCTSGDNTNGGDGNELISSTKESVSDEQATLSSADTIKLHSLASQDTVKLCQPGSTIDISSLQNRQLRNLNSSFNLIANVSDQNISLASIPTISLFSPNVNVLKDPQKLILSSSKNNETYHCPSSSIESNDASLIQQTSHNIDDSKKQICEGVLEDTDEEDNNSLHATELKQTSSKDSDLTRSDTMILPPEDESSQPGKGNDYSLTESDTVIIHEDAVMEKNESKSSEGFAANSNQPQSSGNSSSGLASDPSICRFNLSMTSQPTFSGLPMQSLTGLVLTDSLMSGMCSPSFLSSLLSQSSFNQQQTVLITNTQMNQSLETAMLTDMTQLQPNCANMSGLQSQVNLSTPSTAVLPTSSTASVIVCDNSFSVKGTQTDLALGNAPVYFKPITLTEYDHLSDKEKEEVVQMPSSLSLSSEGGSTSNNSDVNQTNLILDDQAIPASVMNLLSGNMSVTLSSSLAKVSNVADIISSAARASSIVMDKQGDLEQQLNIILPGTQCDCGLAFLSQQELTKHLKEHHKNFNGGSSTDDQSLVDQQDLPKRNSRSKQPPNILKCDLCAATFTRSSNFRRHRKIHNLDPESQQMFTCQDCSREFLRRCDLRRHMLIHTKQQPYKCDTCDKSYIRHSDLVVHKRFHQGVRAYKCDVCDKGFFQSGDLSRHIRRVHNPDTQLTCGHCDKKYASESTLIRHMKVAHKDIIVNTLKKRYSLRKRPKSVQKDEGLMLTVNIIDDNDESQTTEVVT